MHGHLKWNEQVLKDSKLIVDKMRPKEYCSRALACVRDLRLRSGREFVTVVVARNNSVVRCYSVSNDVAYVQRSKVRQKRHSAKC